MFWRTIEICEKKLRVSLKKDFRHGLATSGKRCGRRFCVFKRVGNHDVKIKYVGGRNEIIAE